VAKLNSGMRTGMDPIFYFDEERLAESGIDDAFFTPVLRKLDLNPESIKVTLDDISCYLLDMEPFLDRVLPALSETDPVGDVLDRLRSDGHASLAEHITEHLDELQNRVGTGLDALRPKYRGPPVTNPDLVARDIFTTPEWWLVDIDENVVFDNTMTGLHCREGIDLEALATLLNTPLYRTLQYEAMPLFRGEGDYVRFRHRELEKLPIIRGCLTPEFAERVRPLLPATSSQQELLIRTRTIKATADEHREAVDSVFEAVAKPGLEEVFTEEQLTELRRRIKYDEAPEEYLIEQFGAEVFADIKQLLTHADLFAQRRDVLADLLELFDRARYQTFLVGLASQFEGVLVDYIHAIGGEVTTEWREFEEDGETKEREILVFSVPGDPNSKKKNLKRLFDHFFEGQYQMFLQETIRERRNELAHGTLNRSPNRTAHVFLISFFSISLNILHQYIRYLRKQSA
jgi:hypothetical protein